jgi:hypothetical protein
MEKSHREFQYEKMAGLRAEDAMPIKTEIWRIDNGLAKVSFSSLEAEKKLESAIDKDIAIIDPDLMIIGRQVPTSFGKYIDLLAIDSEGRLAILELKRDRTPREVVAQSLDYASWVQELTLENIKKIFSQYETTMEFEVAFEEKFGGGSLDAMNEEHKILIVASELDNSTERIVNYLSSNYGVPINAVFFQYFKDGEAEYLSRSWLIDPVQVEKQASKTAKPRSRESWNGTDYYVSFGEGPTRNWEDAVKYGFISAGGGHWYSNTLSLLHPGARVFVCIAKAGYVGVGIVKEDVVPVKEFLVDVDGVPTPILKLHYKAPDMDKNTEDIERSEYLVRVDWIITKPIDQGVWEKGMFANQNSACKLRSKFTIERLTDIFKLAEISGQEEAKVEVNYPLRIRAQHKGETFNAELLNAKGIIRFDGKEYPTPTTAAKVIVTEWKEVNGWDFWRYLNPSSGNWEKIGKLRNSQ